MSRGDGSATQRTTHAVGSRVARIVNGISAANFVGKRDLTPIDSESAEFSISVKREIDGIDKYEINRSNFVWEFMIVRELREHPLVSFQKYSTMVPVLEYS